jgi:hypothetical protein
MKRRRFVSPVIVALTVLVVAPLRAAEPETADELVVKGVELRRKGDHAGALREFQAAHAKQPSGRTLAQMGLAEATLRQWTDAEDHLSQALDSTAPWIEKNRATLEQTIQTVRSHTAEVSVYGPFGAVVTIGDKVVGQIPLPRLPRVNEGPVVVKIESSGHKAFSQTIAAHGGARVIVTASLEPLPSEPAVPILPATLEGETSPEGVSGRPWRRWTGVGLLTVGVAAATWGIVWIAVDGQTSWSNSNLVWNTRTPGLFILGGGVAASLGGGYLFYSSRHGEVQVAAAPTGLMGRF